MKPQTPREKGHSEPETTVATLSAPLAPLSYSVADFCAATGLSRSHVYQYLAQGTLVSRYSGRRRIILVADANAFLCALPDNARSDDRKER